MLTPRISTTTKALKFFGTGSEISTMIKTLIDMHGESKLVVDLLCVSPTQTDSPTLLRAEINRLHNLRSDS